MLSVGEYIIKLETNPSKATSWSKAPQRSLDAPNDNFVATPQASWKKFLQDKIQE
jgi:hypothetical protein